MCYIVNKNTNIDIVDNDLGMSILEMVPAVQTIADQVAEELG